MIDYALISNPLFLTDRNNKKRAKFSSFAFWMRLFLNNPKNMLNDI